MSSGDNQSPLRICLLSYRSNPHCGGQGVYLKNLSRALKDLGHQVDVVSLVPRILFSTGTSMSIVSPVLISIILKTCSGHPR